MSEANESGDERLDLSQEDEEETNKTLTDSEEETEATKPVEEAGGTYPKSENGVQAMDEDSEENTDDEVEEKREVKEGGEETMEDQNTNQVFSDMFLNGEDSGDEDEQKSFMLELERFHKDHHLEYKPPKFYGKWLNCLKLWRQVVRLGGYEIVTSCKLWRQVGESFRPPKTCTTISWSFRIFYEKALLEYEKYKIQSGELRIPGSSNPEPITDRQVGIGSQAGRVRRDAAQRAMEGWHSNRNAEDKGLLSAGKKDKNVKNIGGSISNKKKKMSSASRVIKSDSDSMVIDVGPPADWVKVNVRQTKDCYEVYALVPGLLREEVHVQSDPAGRLVISGEPEQVDNPWGVTPFKKVISLPSRIDPNQTSAVVTLHGQLFVRVPFENSDV